MKPISEDDLKSPSTDRLMELWSKKWLELCYENVYFRAIEQAIDFLEVSDFYYDFLKNYIETDFCEYVGERLTSMDWDEDKCVRDIRDFLRSLPNVPENPIIEKHLLFSIKILHDYIKAYLDKHKITLVNTGRSEWKTIRFMSNFPQLDTNFLLFWHERRDNESGEFVVLEKRFVHQCLKNDKFPDVEDIDYVALIRALEIYDTPEID
jgi:hypothetical protein